MARWRLITTHHLAVEGNEWEYKETDRINGKEIRKRVKVPLLLDINDNTLWNDNILRNPRGEILGGDIVVALKGTEHKENDYIFTGEPTPDMMPLDSEAEAITKKLEPKWKASPNDDLPYAQGKELNITEEQQKLMEASRTVKVEGMGEMLQAMQEMMKQNAALIATLVSVSKADRRV